MSLEQKQWTRVSIHHVVLAWLRAERDTRLVSLIAGNLPQILLNPGLDALLNKADLNDLVQNHARLRMLYLYRNVFVVEIPPDTEWYELRNLTDAEIDELYVINLPEWNDPGDRNELRKVAARKPQPLRAPPAQWESPILWAHDRSGPFTIIEGTNRLTAYVSAGQSGLDIPVYVGLSPMAFYFNINDQCDTPLFAQLVQK